MDMHNLDIGNECHPDVLLFNEKLSKKQWNETQESHKAQFQSKLVLPIQICKYIFPR